jgi:phosphate transport system permease protein
MTNTESMTNSSTPPRALTRTVSPARRAQNTIMLVLVGVGTAIVLLPLFLILFQVVYNGVTALNLEFFLESERDASVLTGGGGVLNAIVGTLMMVGIALVIGLVVGISTGIFLSEYREHPLVPTVRVMSDVLTGIPAIVVGLVIYGLMVTTRAPGYSGLAGGVALGLIMIPIIVRATEEVLKLVPTSIREAGLALGLPRWKVTMQIVLPAASSGIITGAILGVARVSGEAAPLIFTAFGNPDLVWNLLQPMSALPYAVYNLAFKALTPAQNAQAWSGALVLLVIILSANLAARYFSRTRNGGQPRAKPLTQAAATKA